MTQSELTSLGFNFESLPSGRVNLSHTVQFKINGFLCISAIRGKWLRTFEQKSLESVAEYIKKIEFIE